MSFSLRYLAHSEVGRIRKNNQDAGYASPTMLAVADGMGGAAAGDLASAVAVVIARDADEKLTGQAMLSHMEGVLDETNTRLSQLVSHDLTLDGMGTTFCGAMFDGTQLGLTHIGDSRCYLLRDGELSQLTHDHSWVQQLIDDGRLSPEQAATHPHRSLIIRVLNGQHGSRPDVELVDVQLGDRIMFCSDGLSGLVNDDELRQYLTGDDLSATIDQLTQAANTAGGHDNITIVLADVVEKDDALDGAEPQLVGSAVERKIPDLRKPAAPPPTTPDDGSLLEEGGEERARYAPEVPSRRWPGVIAGTLAILLVIGGASWAVIAYSTSRFYIAGADDQVAIYNGLPGSILGYELNSLTERTDIAISDLPRFYQRAVTNTIAAADLDSARASVAELRWKAERCVEVREERSNAAPSPPTPTTSPSGLSTGQPNYPTYLAPMTPTATEESDPEAC